MYSALQKESPGISIFIKGRLDYFHQIFQDVVVKWIQYVMFYLYGCFSHITKVRAGGGSILVGCNFGSERKCFFIV